MNRHMLAEFWRFTKAEIKVATYWFFMPVRVIAQGIYQIVAESDSELRSGTGSNSIAKQSKHG